MARFCACVCLSPCSCRASGQAWKHWAPPSLTICPSLPTPTGRLLLPLNRVRARCWDGAVGGCPIRMREGCLNEEINVLVAAAVDTPHPPLSCSSAVPLQLRGCSYIVAVCLLLLLCRPERNERLSIHGPQRNEERTKTWSPNDEMPQFQATYVGG